MLALWHWLAKVVLLFLFFVFRSEAASTCSPNSFSSPDLFGAEILSISAAPVENYTGFPRLFLEGRSLDATGISFCNVTVIYTHPGQNDHVTVQVWLPLNGWNGRFQGTGGAGFTTGMLNGDLISAAVSNGYAAAATDGGHDSAMGGGAPWALLSPGNINYPLFYDFAYVSLHDMTVIAKQIVQQYYGKPAKYSYWSGCSTGGRQGLMFAQRYPDDYDGILSMAPALYFPKLIASTYWPQQVMNSEKIHPRICELEAINAAVIEACDDLDGVHDGIISATETCKFDAKSLVGKFIDCEGEKIKVSAAAARIAEATWDGPRGVDGRQLWHGLVKGSPFTGMWATANTACDERGCNGMAFPIAVAWLKMFLKKDPTFNERELSFAEFEKLIRQSTLEYDSIISTDDPDLSRFKAAGHKIISWHGIHDELIPVQGSRQYYSQVQAEDSNVRDFYRYFEAPGVGHCGQGLGTYPYESLDALTKWVEEGVAPELLNTKPQGQPDKPDHRPLCPYPLVASYKGGDINAASSFECTESFSVGKGRQGKDEL